MRLSDATFRLNLLHALHTSRLAFERAQQRVVTGRRIETMSDAPADAAEVMRLERQARTAVTQRSAATFADTRLSAEDVVLDASRKLLEEARQIALSAASAPPGDPLRQQAANQIAEFHKQLVDLGNTRIGNEFIFSGGLSQTPAFADDGTYLGDSTARSVEVGDGTTVVVNHTGDQALVGAIGSLGTLQAELLTGDATAVQGAADQVDFERGALQTVQGETAARLGTVRDAQTRLAERTASLLDRRDALRDVPQAEAVMEALAAQTALDRAYEIIGRVLSTSLLEHLS